MKKIVKIFLIVLAVLGGLSFFAIQKLTYAPSPVAEEAVLAAKIEDDVTLFAAEDADATSIILYQGAFVEDAAYAPLAKQLSEAGFNVYLLDTPLNLPVLAEKRGLEVLEAYQLEQVIFMGHSLGGVIAARNAASLMTSDTLAGLVFLASYPDDSVDLSQANFPILSITASEDDVINAEAFAAATQLLPQGTHYEVIAGGNHSGFGDYGQQAKDGQASITASQQRQAIVEFVTEIFK